MFVAPDDIENEILLRVWLEPLSHFRVDRAGLARLCSITGILQLEGYDRLC